VGEAAAPSLSRGMRRGQESPADKSQKKDQAGSLGAEGNALLPFFL